MNVGDKITVWKGSGLMHVTVKSVSEAREGVRIGWNHPRTAQMGYYDSLNNEGISWVRGHVFADSPEIQALLAVEALR